MTARPGTPITVTDEYLAAILAELREINAKLGQDVVITTTDTITVDTAFDPEAIKAVVAEALDARSGMVL